MSDSWFRIPAAIGGMLRVLHGLYPEMAAHQEAVEAGLHHFSYLPQFISHTYFYTMQTFFALEFR